MSIADVNQSLLSFGTGGIIPPKPPGYGNNGFGGRNFKSS